MPTKDELTAEIEELTAEIEELMARVETNAELLVEVCACAFDRGQQRILGRPGSTKAFQVAECWRNLND